MFFKKSNKQQSGRSMVEMLGVLAIIGVLSIGGIAGYTLSMRRYRANQVLDIANKYALVVYGACQKALLDGDSKLNDAGIVGCDFGTSDLYPSFSEANLGTVGDAQEILFTDIEKLEDGSDSVNILITLRDTQVCKAISSIIGSRASDHCSSENVIVVPFNFN